jgi:hypothetical protein
MTDESTPLLTQAEIAAFADFHEQYVSKNIQLADAKAAAVVAACSAAIAFLVSEPFFRASALGFSTLSDFLACLALATLAVGASLAFWVIVPRLGTSGRGLVFWGDVASYKNAHDYFGTVQTTPFSIVTTERLSHCFDLAKVCVRKMEYVRRAMLVSAAGFVSSIWWVLLFSRRGQ